MTTEEKIAAKIADLKARKANGTITEEELVQKKEQLRSIISQLKVADEAPPREWEKQDDTQPSFASRIGASPFEGMMNAVVEQQRKSGVPTSETAEMMKQGLANAADIGTGAALVRGGVGELAGGSYLDSDEALLNAITKGVPTDILEKEKVLQGYPRAQWLADALLNASDPAMIAGGAGLLKRGIQSGGKELYRSGLKNIDKLGLRKGKGATSFSDTALKYGISGSSEDIMNKSDDVVEALMKERDKLFSDAASKGAVADPDKTLKPVIAKAEQMAANTKKFGSSVKEQAAKFADELKAFTSENKYVPERAPEPEQIPAFFGEELPSKKSQFISGENIVADLSPTAVPTTPEQMDLLAMSPEARPMTKQESVVREMGRAEPVGVGREAPIIMEPPGKYPHTVMTPTSDLTDAQILEILNKQEGILPQGSRLDPGGQRVDRISGLAAPTTKVGEQLEMLSASEMLANKKPTATKMESWIYPQETSIIDKGQQLLLRPSELTQPQKKLLASGGLNPLEASTVKTDMYNMMGSNAFDILKTDTQGQKLLKLTADRMNKATTAAVRKVDPKAARRLKEINKDMGALLTGRPAAFNEYSKEMTKNAFTSVDAPLSILNPAAFLGKKAADIGKTAQFRTGVGQALTDENLARILGGVGGLGAASAKANVYQSMKKD